MKPWSRSCWLKKSHTTAAPVQKCSNALEKKYPFPLKLTANQSVFPKSSMQNHRGTGCVCVCGVGWGGRIWRFDIINTPRIVAAETAGVWMSDCVQKSGQSLEHASVHAHFGLQPAISIEYYLLGPSWRLTVTHRCPRTDTLIAVPPMSSAVRSPTDMMIWPAAAHKQNNETLKLTWRQQEDNGWNSLNAA